MAVGVGDGGGGGSKGVLSDVGVGSGDDDDDSTGFFDADAAVFSGAKSAVRELASAGLADCLGSEKASSPRSCTSLSAAFRYIY